MKEKEQIVHHTIHFLKNLIKMIPDTMRPHDHRLGLGLGFIPSKRNRSLAPEKMRATQKPEERQRRHRLERRRAVAERRRGWKANSHGHPGQRREGREGGGME